MTERGAGDKPAGWLSARSTGGALALATFLLCVVGSWVPSLWADEGATISGATRPFPDLWRLIQGIDAVHAVYYVLLHYWLEVTGPGAFWLRLPSAIATAAAAFALHRLAVRLADPLIALCAVVSFALLPRVTWMAIEGRSSAFSTLVAVLLTYVLVRWSASGRTRLLIGYSALLAVGVGLHVYLLLLVGVHGVALVARQAGVRRFLTWAGAAGAGVAAVSPLVLLASRQTGQVGEGFPVTFGLGLRQIAVNQNFLGERPLPTGDPWIDAWQYAAIGMAGVSFALLMLGAVAIRHRPEVSIRALAPAWFGLGWAFLPSLLVLALSLVVDKNLYHPRYFAFCAPGLALALGWAIAQLGSRWRKLVAILLLALLALPIYVSQRGVNAKTGADWSQVVTHLSEVSDDRDGVYFSFSNRIISIAYPGVIDQLRDITIVRDAIHDASLAGESRPLADALRSETPPSTIWAIYRLDRTERDTEDLVFRQAGYTSFVRWRGTLNEVVGYRRT